MRTTNIIIAILAAILIAVVILARPMVSALFTPSVSQVEISAAKANLSKAQSQLDDARKASETAALDLGAKFEQILKAEEEVDTATAELASIGTSKEEIDETISESSAEALLRVEVRKSIAEEIINGIALSGKTEAARKLELRAETSGQVISEPLASGTKITKGDILCELDPGTRQASLEQAEAALNTAQTTYRSNQKLSERGLASKAALQGSLANLEQAQSAVDQATRELERLQIRAPFNGALETQTAELGSLLQPGSVCASIVALDRINLVGYTSESQVAKVKLGAGARGIFRNTDEPLEGLITFVSSTADPVTRTYRVEANVPNNGNILDGASVKIYIALAGSKGHLVPQNAITLNSVGEIGVKIFVDGKVVFQPAEIVRDTPEGTWIAGLPDEVDIIITGQEYAADGRAVEAVYSEDIISPEGQN